jgi:hydroxymethylpyrimidine/phosphomethylpyrimidine kinase
MTPKKQSAGRLCYPGHEMPVGLTIAGSDSGGEAGIQADLKTFAALGVHGTSAITCLTAQNPAIITRVEPCSPQMVRAQIEAVFAYMPPKAAKTGLLHSAAIIRELVDFFRQRPAVPLVVDPVMVATSGRRLLLDGAARLLQRDLLPLATLVTPNLAEAEFLTGQKIHTPEDLRRAARQIHKSCGCAALVKGGHLPGTDVSVDFLCGASGEWMLSTPRIKGVALHGTGCTYSAAITAWLARGCPLLQAVTRAKTYIAAAIAAQEAVGESPTTTDRVPMPPRP